MPCAWTLVYTHKCYWTWLQELLDHTVFVFCKWSQYIHRLNTFNSSGLLQFLEPHSAWLLYEQCSQFSLNILERQNFVNHHWFLNTLLRLHIQKYAEDQLLLSSVIARKKVAERWLGSTFTFICLLSQEKKVSERC